MAPAMDFAKIVVYQSTKSVHVETHPNIFSLSDKELLGRYHKAKKFCAIANKGSRRQFWDTSKGLSAT